MCREGERLDQGSFISYSKYFDFVVRPRRSHRKILIRGGISSGFLKKILNIGNYGSVKFQFHWVDLDLFKKLRPHLHITSTKTSWFD